MKFFSGMRSAYLPSALSIVILAGLAARAHAGDVSLYLAQTTAADPGALINQYLTFIYSVAGLLAFAYVAYGGVKYIVAAGNPSGQSDAKDNILQAIYGILLLAGSALVLRTISPTLLNVQIGGLSELEVPQAPAAGGLTDTVARSQLTEKNIGIKPGVVLVGVRQAVIAALIAAKEMCGGCEMTITAGTDGTHKEGACSHYAGFKADVRKSGSLTSFIKGSWRQIGYRGDDGPGTVPLYQGPNGSVWAEESDHWDMKAGC